MCRQTHTKPALRKLAEHVYEIYHVEKNTLDKPRTPIKFWKNKILFSKIFKCCWNFVRTKCLQNSQSIELSSETHFDIAFYASYYAKSIRSPVSLELDHGTLNAPRAAEARPIPGRFERAPPLPKVMSHLAPTLSQRTAPGRVLNGAGLAWRVTLQAAEGEVRNSADRRFRLGQPIQVVRTRKRIEDKRCAGTHICSGIPRFSGKAHRVISLFILNLLIHANNTNFIQQVIHTNQII